MKQSLFSTLCFGKESLFLLNILDWPVSIIRELECAGKALGLFSHASDGEMSDDLSSHFPYFSVCGLLAGFEVRS